MRLNWRTAERFSRNRVPPDMSPTLAAAVDQGVQSRAINRRLLAELSGTTVASFVVLVAGMVTGLLAAQCLGTAGRGELTAITIWATTLLYAGSFGLGEATAYFAGRRSAQADSVFLTSQVLAVAVSMAVLALGVIAVPIFLGKQNAIVQYQARWYLALFLVPGLSSLCATSWLQGSGHIGTFNVVRSAVHIVTAVLMAAFAIASKATVQTFLGAMLVGNAVTWLLALLAWRSRRSGLARYQRELAFPLLKYGTTVQLGSWSAAANVRLDQLLLASFAASSSLGVYVVAVSYAGLVLLCPTIANIVMLPRLLRDTASGCESSAVWPRRILWATVGAGACLWASAGVLVPTLFGSAFAESVSLQRLLIPGACLLGMNQVLGTVFRAHGKPAIASRAEMLGVVFTVSLLAVLLPKYGIYGAAVTSLCAYAVVFGYLVYNARGIAPTMTSLWVPQVEDLRLVRDAARPWLFGRVVQKP